MGLTYVELNVSKTKGAPERQLVRLLVDSGAIFSVVPSDVLQKLGVEPDELKTFSLADGQTMARSVGDAYFQFQGKGGYSKVIFGEKDDGLLLGALTLEALGLMLDPLKRELKPLPMLLM
jgi:predicted aspartyl protease